MLTQYSSVVASVVAKVVNYSFALVLFTALTACGTNPVTKKKEFQFVSQDKEIAIGKENYSPARQSQGGDYIIDPELTTYVQGIGKRLAAVSDRSSICSSTST